MKTILRPVFVAFLLIGMGCTPGARRHVQDATQMSAVSVKVYLPGTVRVGEKAQVVVQVHNHEAETQYLAVAPWLRIVTGFWVVQSTEPRVSKGAGVTQVLHVEAVCNHSVWVGIPPNGTIYVPATLPPIDGVPGRANISFSILLILDSGEDCRDYRRVELDYSVITRLNPKKASG